MPTRAKMHAPRITNILVKHFLLVISGTLALYTFLFYNSASNTAVKNISKSPSSSSIKYLSELTSKILSSRYKPLTNFTFCPILNDSLFDSFVHIYELNSTMILLSNHDKIVQLIDGNAKNILKEFMDRYDFLVKEEIHRYACYSAAEGITPYIKSTSQRFLHAISPQAYFYDLLPSITPSPPPSSKRKYKLAYLIMVHKLSEFPNLKKLITALNDGTALILIHVDLKVPEYRSTIQKYLDQDLQSVHVHLSRKSFWGEWGHSALVMMQLNGFWELLDLGDWEYVINLSNTDWPLRRNADVYKYLDAPKYKGKSQIRWWTSTEESAILATRPYFRKKKDAAYPGIHATFPAPYAHLRWIPYADWKTCKQHQWGVFSRDFIIHTRTNDLALQALAYYEFVRIPDESFFCSLTINNATLLSNTVNKNTRYHKFNGPHPITLTMHDIGGFDGEKHRSRLDLEYLFIRKVNSTKDLDLLEWIEKNHWL